MSHFAREQWSAYVQNRLSGEERRRCEEHLYICEHCLTVYLECVEREGAALPELKKEDAFTEAVMRRVLRPEGRHPERLHPEGGDRADRRTLLHYTAAAAVTLVLMSSGMFQALLADVQHIQRAEAAHSLSDRLMEKAVAAIESLRPKT
jgi:anti-sigma factor RsiW